MIRRVLQALPLRRHRIMLDAMTAAERLLSYWQIGLIHADDIVEWADRLITEAPPGVIVPPWLITLSTRGPKAYSRLAERGSPRPRLLSFDETFDALLEVTSIEDDESIQRFSQLFLGQVIGGDLNDPLVHRGYLIDALRDSGDVSAAAAEAIDLLKEHQGRCHPIRDTFRATLGEADRVLGGEGRVAGGGVPLHSREQFRAATGRPDL